MLRIMEYNRKEVLQYANQWALKRNPHYLDFTLYGGDCTNFASQCIYAGSGIMNYTPIVGWYYNNSYDRSASWTGVQYFYDFLTGNKSIGPFGVETSLGNIQPGDIVQLYGRNQYYHSLVIVNIQREGVFVAAHSNDAYMRPLNTYVYEKERFIHIQGVRK